MKEWEARVAAAVAAATAASPAAVPQRRSLAEEDNITGEVPLKS